MLSSVKTKLSDITFIIILLLSLALFFGLILPGTIALLFCEILLVIIGILTIVGFISEVRQQGQNVK